VAEELFARRTTTALAFRWDGSAAANSSVVRWANALGFTATVNDEDDLEIEQGGGLVTEIFNRGDWVTQDSEGYLRRMDTAEFDREFVARG